VFGRHAHALGDGNLDGLIRVQAVRYALQDNRCAATRKEIRR
jgi:hypothetical protein